MYSVDIPSAAIGTVKFMRTFRMLGCLSGVTPLTRRNWNSLHHRKDDDTRHPGTVARSIIVRYPRHGQRSPVFPISLGRACPNQVFFKFSMFLFHGGLWAQRFAPMDEPRGHTRRRFSMTRSQARAGTSLNTSLQTIDVDRKSRRHLSTIIEETASDNSMILPTCLAPGGFHHSFLDGNAFWSLT